MRVYQKYHKTTTLIILAIFFSYYSYVEDKVTFKMKTWVNEFVEETKEESVNTMLPMSQAPIHDCCVDRINQFTQKHILKSAGKTVMKANQNNDCS